MFAALIRPSAARVGCRYMNRNLLSLRQSPMPATAKRRPGFRLGLESLEGRALMAATPIDFAATLTQAPVAMNGAMYFTASDSAHGTELWKSNGTTQGTVLLKNI